MYVLTMKRNVERKKTTTRMRPAAWLAEVLMLPSAAEMIHEVRMRPEKSLALFVLLNDNDYRFISSR